MPETPPSSNHPFQQLITSFEAEKDAARLLAARSSLVDATVIAEASRFLPSPTSLPFALCAVGGYGRRELFPYSDIDLLIVVEEESQLRSFESALSDFLRVLWDAKLRLSHSVRPIAECCKPQDDNPELHISLLDLRFLHGDLAVFRKLERRLAESFDRFRPSMVRRLVELSRSRHLKFNNTVYHLEPNVKETCGGLRDLHLLRWLTQLLPQREVLSEALSELQPSAGFLFNQRCFLHLCAHRDANLLTFDLQDQSARLLPPAPTAPEAWMRLYYGHARTIYQAARRALDYADTNTSSFVSQLRDWRPRFSTPEFTVAHDRVLLRNAADTLHSPENILRLFTFVGRHGIALSWDAVRRIRASLPALTEAFRSESLPWTLWRQFLAQPHTALAIEEMNTCGVLAAAVPEWQVIDSLVVRDFYHRYTVDEHTVVALRSIDDLAAGVAPSPQRFLQLATEEDQLPLLRLALLLHDLGKGILPGEHVKGSLQAAPAVMRRFGVPPLHQEAVLFLIRHHLALSIIMNGRDLEDPATARALTSSVETQEDLRRLTLLTYADISAVNPTAMTPWRLEQLWRVYLLGTEQLTRELASERLHHLASSASWTSAEAAFLEGFPKRYLRTHSPQQIRRHMELEALSRREGVAVEIRPEGGVWLITVLAPDKPGLFAALCGALASFGMNILKGEASSNAAGTALDLIRFADPNRTLELNPEEQHRLDWTVQCVIRGSVSVVDLLKRRKPARRSLGESSVVPNVKFDHDASDTATLIDFTAEDRPGLLYDLASTISANGCNLEVVMIDTEAHKAMDVFYVTANGAKLDGQTEELLHRDLLRAAARRESADSVA